MTKRCKLTTANPGQTTPQEANGENPYLATISKPHECHEKLSQQLAVTTARGYKKRFVTFMRTNGLQESEYKWYVTIQRTNGLGNLTYKWFVAILGTNGL